MKRTPAQQQDYDRIVIERRMVVATIERDPDDTRGLNMLQAAYVAACDAMCDALTDARSSDRVEFVYGDHRFTASAEPATASDGAVAA